MGLGQCLQPPPGTTCFYSILVDWQALEHRQQLLQQQGCMVVLQLYSCTQPGCQDREEACIQERPTGGCWCELQDGARQAAGQRGVESLL
jgi:hypothetical protein